MECSTNLPQAAFFSAEEKVQLISGNCPRHITKERLKEWLSFRKGTAKDGSGWWRKEYLRQPLCHFSLCNLDGRVKVFKLLFGGWKEVIFKKQKIIQTTSSLIS